MFEFWVKLPSTYSRAVSLTGRYESSLDETKTSGEILAQIRELMRDTDVVGSEIHAYIITSVDAHQVHFIVLW